MKNNILKKVGIGILSYVIVALYTSGFIFLHGYGFVLSNFLSFFNNWWLVASIFVLVFAYPYIKISSRSLWKRGLFFGLMAWLINLPRVLIELRQALIALNVTRFLLSVGGPVYFVILGLVISFCYKRFLSSEFEISLQKSKVPLSRTALFSFISALIYFLFMFFAGFWLLKQGGGFRSVSILKYTTLLSIYSFVNPLILGSIFTVLYNRTIGRVEISNTKEWLLFTSFVFFLTEPLVISVREISIQQFWKIFPRSSSALVIPHLLAILVIGYILVNFFGKKNRSHAL